MRRKVKSTWVISASTDQWWQSMLGPDVPDNSWKNNFRTGKEAFLGLAAELLHFCALEPNSSNHCLLVTEKTLAVTL